MRRSGFTLIEVTIALVIGGMALSAAAALLTGLSHRADQIRVAAARVDRDGNAERMLRSLFENLRFSTDSTRTLKGDSSTVTFYTRCETVEGWLRPCTALIKVNAIEGFLVHLKWDGQKAQTVEFRRDDGSLRTIRYLRDVNGGGQWTKSWTEIVVPIAVQLIAGTDTLLLPTW